MWELLGKWVHYTHEVMKDIELLSGGVNYTLTHKSIPRPGIGMIIGRRWLPSGTAYQESDDNFGSSTWMAFSSSGETTPCYLVVKDDRTNPVRVDPSGVVLLEEFSKLVPIKYLDVVMTQAGK